MAHMIPDGPLWSRALAAPRRRASDLGRGDVPTHPGVYIWFRDGEPVYAGRAKGNGGLRSRLAKHLASGLDLSHSTLRASVAVRELGVTRAHARSRPTVMTSDQIGVVNAWLAECEIAWLVCSSVEETIALEDALIAEWRPPINIR